MPTFATPGPIVAERATIDGARFAMRIGEVDDTVKLGIGEGAASSWALSCRRR